MFELINQFHTQIVHKCCDRMDNITEITYGPLPVDSPYVRPFRLYYTQNGIVKNWDLLKVHDSVVIIVFNTTKKTLVFVKQFRPGRHYYSNVIDYL